MKLTVDGETVTVTVKDVPVGHGERHHSLDFTAKCGETSVTGRLALGTSTQKQFDADVAAFARRLAFEAVQNYRVRVMKEDFLSKFNKEEE